MSDERVGRFIKQQLNQSLNDIPDDVTNRLAMARMSALARQKQTVPAYSFAGTIGNFFNAETRYFKHLLAGLVLLAGLSMYAYNESELYIQEAVDVDSALLADEIPIGAYMDRDFVSWLEENESNDTNTLQ